MQIGAILAGADDAVVKAMGEVAAKVGFAFQVRDDILDVSGAPEELGKPVGSDEKNNKTTYVTLYGMREAIETAERLSEEALEILARYPGGESGGMLAELISSLANRTA